ncbi:Mobile element protein [uncultured Gammaproteobacteria bacterium]|nr:Mobile element protein [uncultured Gammaproteobacteria bacterium]
MSVLFCSLSATLITNTSVATQNYMPGMPCNATELVHFRKRIGVKGFNLIFKMSVALHGKQAQESSVLIDTTVQEKTSLTPPMPNLLLKSSIALISWQSVMAFNNAEPMLKRLKTATLIRHFRPVKKRAKARKL